MNEWAWACIATIFAISVIAAILVRRHRAASMALTSYHEEGHAEAAREHAAAMDAFGEDLKRWGQR